MYKGVCVCVGGGGFALLIFYNFLSKSSWRRRRGFKRTPSGSATGLDGDFLTTRYFKKESMYFSIFKC